MERLGKYELLKHIADGATAAVLLAHDPFAGRDVAIKLFRSQVFNENERGTIARKLFMAEAALAGKLDHPHIVRIFDAVMEEGRSYIVMEYVPGGTLHAYTSPDRLLPLADVVEIAFKCSRALGYAQRLGVIHCDLKPANILFAGTPGGIDIKVSDFGSAFNLAAEETVVVGLGSPAYMSPQQIKEHPLNHQTDIFSLGIVMYELLTGLRPFRGAGPMARADPRRGSCG
jgi:serine/threonine protein kinase